MSWEGINRGDSCAGFFGRHEKGPLWILPEEGKKTFSLKTKRSISDRLIMKEAG